MIGLERHILAIANELNKPITNLQLQKIWYFTLGYLVRTNQNELAEREFNNSNLEAWLYGPVVPSFYEKYKKYKKNAEDLAEKTRQQPRESINN